MLKIIYILINHVFLTYLPTYIGLTSCGMGYQGKSDINSVNVHPQLDHKGHPMDGATG
jgi:hypothetical protein